MKANTVFDAVYKPKHGNPDLDYLCAVEALSKDASTVAVNAACEMCDGFDDEGTLSETQVRALYTVILDAERILAMADPEVRGAAFARVKDSDYCREAEGREDGSNKELFELFEAVFGGDR